MSEQPKSGLKLLNTFVALCFKRLILKTEKNYIPEELVIFEFPLYSLTILYCPEMTTAFVFQVTWGVIQGTIFNILRSTVMEKNIVNSILFNLNYLLFSRN